MSKILILGYSNIAQKRIIPALESIESISSIEICSISKKPDLNGKIDKIHDSYDDAIKNFKGTLIYISLSNQLHDEYIKKVCDEGFNCIVDKPAFLDENTLKYVKNIKKQNHLFIAESVVFQEHPAWKKSINLLNGKDNIFNVNAYFTVPYFDENNFRMHKILKGGVLNDMSAYSIGIGRWLWNLEPIKINIANLNYVNDLLRGFSVLIEYDNNKTVSGFFGFGYEYRNEISMFSSSGYLGYERAFSAPKDMELNLNGKIDNKDIALQVESSDSFRNFLLKTCKDDQDKLKGEWTKKTIQTYKDYSLLKEAIINAGGKL